MVDIIMACYNGERYIRQQINSLLGQTYTDWKLTVRDDGSNDGTKDILLQYVYQYPEKICLLESKQNLGAKDNFFKLLESCSADYIFFCDQDDIWEKDKIEKTMAVMLKAEESVGETTPVLVHTDLALINDLGETISRSFWGYSKINGKEDRLSRILVQNNVTGCTMCINRALSEKAVYYDAAILMHDWWIALIAAAFGVIRFVDAPTIRYRQHISNEVGAKDYNSIAYKAQKVKQSAQIAESINLTITQAALFKKIFQGRLRPSDLKAVADYSNIKRYSKLSKIRLLLKHNLLKFGLVRNIGLFLYI